MTTETLYADAPAEAALRHTDIPQGLPPEQHNQTPTRLPRPAGIVPGKIAWNYVIGIGGMHLFALAAFVPWFFSWSGVILMLIGTHVFGSGINIGYHRLLTHRSFKCPRWVERVFVYLAVCCMEDAPATWVATHRLHHKDSDDQPDPHSPWVSFWWSHMGWLFVHNREVNNANAFDKFARDILKDPFYMWMQRGLNWMWLYISHAVAFFAAGFGIGWLAGGTSMAGLQLGLSWLVWCVIVRTVVVWHITWSVNSFSHLFGYRSFETREESRNNWFVAAIAAGEGWHNNHHDDPTAAANWHRWWEVDISYVTIKALAMMGLAWDLVPRRIDSRRKHQH